MIIDYLQMNSTELKERTKVFAHEYVKFAVDENIAPGDVASPLMKKAKELTAIFIPSEKTFQNRNLINNPLSIIHYPLSIIHYP